ncbi:helix-turn-helix domain-containing protein [Galactobacter valiniphilus]|uniref:helix-turn-helix domain-containing protein n=1 Tax=Galactobacter valiniphilus TaxID=2676122 RepID=UPI0011C3D073|nr:helix-turn-helix domain-containing protein [Galactobacter valiniphilus]
MHGKLVGAGRHDWGMHDEQQVGSRRTEARSVMERLNAAFDGARDLLEGLDAVEARVLNEPVPQVLLDTASRVQEASQQLQSGLRELVEYMIEDRGVSRKKVAEHLGLSPSTVARWMQERE